MRPIYAVPAFFLTKAGHFPLELRVRAFFGTRPRFGEEARKIPVKNCYIVRMNTAAVYFQRRAATKCTTRPGVVIVAPRGKRERSRRFYAAFPQQMRARSSWPPPSGRDRLLD